MDISAIALQGIAQATAGLERAAARIASAGDTSVDGAGLDVVDLSAEVVALMTNQNAYAANIQTIKTANEIQKSALDLFA